MPDAFDDILDANREYASSFDLHGIAAPAARRLGVLTCIDSRIEPLAMLGLRAGDAKIFRNAGARVTDDALRSLVLATNLLAVERIMVVIHTNCAVSGTTDEAIRAQLAVLHPDVDLDEFSFGATTHQHAALIGDLQRIREHPLISEGVVIGGFEYDVDTGLLREVPYAS